ncbi:MAG: N-6 DNA methylase [Gemmatimonadota bacterium]|nr:N-6 DNA methylase [Gemmatimonadota bacterium]MDH3367362.1 N-6 DNA methylase [Gemmatimonadota bacterium]MDH3476880.1 N-6 DNA methylase [Gemmatimonadota bacterium]MDH3570515.1 N-6 DNA methylase [Gemmatimonadota bacterium]MDH5548504.1 N-6 DNA methylase [Gemmatimonadota bacterium]
MSALFARLGYRPVGEPWAEGALVVAKWHAFKVIAIQSADPRGAARALAHRLSASGLRGLAVALGPGELAIAAPRLGTPGSSKVLGVSLHQPSRVALAQMRELRPRNDSTALAHALRVADTLSSEAVGEYFFREFSSLLDGMAATIDDHHREEDRRLAVLLTLTRILFLYFIQAKGWLDGKHDYLRQRLDESLSRGIAFHERVLDPLFFGTLNRPLPERMTNRACGTIPYLNGGLFERHAIERKLGQPRFSNELWAHAFDRLFDRYRFCVREAEEVDAVAPDTLGRVFERLMDSRERLRSGTFYTPESVVHQIVRAALGTTLPRLGGMSADAARRLLAGDPLLGIERVQARRALRILRILDPAAGSGAFLLGALEILTDLTLRLEDNDCLDPWTVRRRVLRENLFGVDINPMAVRLAELRLWLAVVADDPTTDISQIVPLPNLDGVVRQGDSLLDPIAAARLALGRGPGANRDIVKEVAAIRRKVFDARGRSTRRIMTALARAEHRLAQSMVERSIGAAQAQLQDLEHVTRGRDLFGHPASLNAGQRRHLLQTRQNLEALRRAKSALEDGALPFFAFEVHIPDVMTDGGFHLVIGNPPWVRAERLAPAMRVNLSQRFRLWRSRNNAGFAHLPDLSIAFLERFLELAAPGGAVALIVPSKVASAGYGEAMRRHMVRETTVTYLHRLPDRQAARFGATTYPLAIIAHKSAPPDDHRIQLGFDASASVCQTALQDPGPWILVPNHGREALERLRASGVPLQDVVTPQLGVKTGADDVFVGRLVTARGPLAVVRFGSEEAPIEISVLRPVVRGRDVKPFRTGATRVILWACDHRGRPSTSLPPRAAAYLERHRARLERRSDYRGGPLWTVFRTGSALGAHRIVWPDIARRPCAVMLDATDQHDALPLNSCYIASVRTRMTALAITAILNSCWFAALAAVVASEARGGYRRINASVVAQLPVPRTERGLSDLAAVTERAQRNDDVSLDQVDAAVAETLDLSPTVQHELRKLGSPHRR